MSGKTYSDLKTAVANWLTRTDLTSYIPDFINAAQLDLERRHNFRFMRTNALISLAADDHTKTNPILRYKDFISMEAYTSTDPTRRPIVKRNRIHAISLYPDLTNSVGQPVLVSEVPQIESLTLSIGSTDTAVASTAFDYIISDVLYSKAAVAAGTALASGTVPSGKWGAWLYSINSAGTVTCTAATANGTTGYNTEALAIAAVPALPDQHYSMGHVTVKTKTGQAFIPGTDSLKGGAAGNVASETNYYTTDQQPLPKLLFRPTADEAYTVDFWAYQYSPELDDAVYRTNWWTQNAWDILLYSAMLRAEPFLYNDARIATWRAFLFGDGDERMPQGALGKLIRAEKDEIYGDGPLNIAGNFGGTVYDVESDSYR